MPLTPEEKLARKRAWTRKAMAKWIAANPEKHRERSRLHKINNPAKSREWASARRARLLKACPPWANRAHIAFIYEHCPAGYEVDHIIPVHGKGFGGLHVPANLQYLPASVNAAKGNRCVDVSTSAIVPPPWTQPHNQEGHV